MGILTLLQAKKFVTAEQLADRFAISVRTVYRDIKALNEINIPVSFENSRGYFIVQGFFLPPVAFSTEEANALLLLEVIAERFSDQSIVKHYKTALTKVKAVLKGVQKDKIEDLHSKIATLDTDGFRNDFAHLADIQNAIINRTILVLDYRDNHQRQTRREIEPIGVLFYAMNWHVIAWCWARKDYRDFVAHRIYRLSSPGHPFRKTDHPGLGDYIRSQEFFSRLLT